MALPCGALYLVPILDADWCLQSDLVPAPRPQVFSGKQLVDWMLERQLACDRDMAEMLGRSLLMHGYFVRQLRHHFWTISHAATSTSFFLTISHAPWNMLFDVRMLIGR